MNDRDKKYCQVAYLFSISQYKGFSGSQPNSPCCSRSTVEEWCFMCSRMKSSQGIEMKSLKGCQVFHPPIGRECNSMHHIMINIDMLNGKIPERQAKACCHKPPVLFAILR